MFDPDALAEKREEIASLEKLLIKFSWCDLSDYDADFVESMERNHEKFGDRMHVTPRQWEHLNRMREKYHVSE